MHVIFRESHGLDEAATPVDLGQSPADLVVLSFSDSDLGAFAAGWHRAGGTLPTLRLANLAALKHPLSVDTYIERTISGAKGILIRLIGGVPYWTYGLQQVEQVARRKGIALAVLPADGRPDPRLGAVSTLPSSTLKRLSDLCDKGGEVAAHAALAQLSLAAGLYAGPVSGTKALPEVGAWSPENGLTCPAAAVLRSSTARILVTFYRAWLAAHDLAPIETLTATLRARGFDVVCLFVPSLKAPEARRWTERWVRHLAPDAIVNATSFSARDDNGASPLDGAGVPVFQIALSTSTQRAWADAERGLSPSDLAMHVVLPEVDGRIFAGVASFKEPATRDPATEFSRYAHKANSERIAALADRVAGWVRLSALDVREIRLALVLSTYPGRSHQMAHAVGLDALASAEAILHDLETEGYLTNAKGSLAEALARETISWPISEYRKALLTLPETLRSSLTQAWGEPDADAAARNGAIHFAALERGSVLVALQPDRGQPESRDAEYHDLSRTPRHGYVAFYLWLRHELGLHALVHIGAHGTLEWLPGKSVALSETCWPEALIADLPVIYPFIVNDPGEAAQAKRRIGAVTLGHVPPALRQGSTPDRLVRLEGLLDEFSNADGLDRGRRDRLQTEIRAEAAAAGVESDLGLDQATSLADAITRIDRFVCDVKESRYGDGLHVFGRALAQGLPGSEASAAAERQGLIDALAGRRVAPGPSGSPYRGRTDVLPTGRNLYTIDPRSVPSRAAHTQGVKLADELVRRHLQDFGDYPRGLVVDLWGSATMRTAGEEFAMALHLLGARPLWDEASDRVSGFEILPLALLDRPRIDVTLRVSGLFRDVFPTLSTLFGQAVRSLSDRDEAPDWNPFVGKGNGSRVYGPAPGSYGLGMGDAAQDYTDEGRAKAGDAWLASSAWALDGVEPAKDMSGIVARVAQADAFVHPQDLPETDLLLAADYAAHEAGFAAAQRIAGGHAALYHLDASNPARPAARPLREEIARVVRGRATNPGWIAGMMRHGFRGAAEIAATLEHLAAFAHLAGVVDPHLFDLYHDATLGDDTVRDFLHRENPEALVAMENCLAALHKAGIWQTRRNSILSRLELRA